MGGFGETFGYVSIRTTNDKDDAQRLQNKAEQTYFYMHLPYLYKNLASE